MVGVDHQGDAGADRVTHRARHRGVLLDAEADLQLHRLEALGDVAGGLLGEVSQRIAGFAPVEPGRVGLYLVAHRPAEQAVHRHAEMLSLDVPQRDVDAAQALDDHALLPVIAQPRVDLAPEIFGAQRIGADQPGRDAVDHRGGHARGAVAFAPAGEARVGRDLDHHRGARVVPGARIGEGLRQRGVQHMGADFGDLHGTPGSWACGTCHAGPVGSILRRVVRPNNSRPGRCQFGI